MDRRNFLFLLSAAMLCAVPLLQAGPSFASDGGDGDGDGGDGDNDGGNGGSGGNDDDSGSGDNGNDDADNSAADADKDNAAPNAAAPDAAAPDDADHVQARDAVQQGRIMPLREILQRVDSMRAGRVLSVDLSLKSKAPVYILKVENKEGGVQTLRLNAVTGRKLGPFGWW